MRMKVAFFVLSFLLPIVSVFGQCGNYTSSSGAVYYLSPLTNSAYDYQGTETGTPYTYYWSFCRNLLSTTCVIPTPATQISAAGTCTPIGYLANYTLTDYPSGPNSGFQLTYVNTVDNKCINNQYNRQTNILVLCDPTVEIAFVSINEPGICVYNIYMRSKYGCPINGPSEVFDEGSIKLPK